MHAVRQRHGILQTAATAALSMVFAMPIAWGDPPGWKLAWSDDFDELDLDRWELVDSHQPTNNSLQAYLPEQIAVENGKLVITSEKKPSGELPYRSGQVVTKDARKYGRWEVRAKLPTTAGMWPAIWLLPDVDEYKWPSGGEIDIMENRGNQPALTSSAFHYGTNPPYSHKFVLQEFQTRKTGELVDFSKDFHTYAVDWTDSQLRLYVDDVHYYTVYDVDVDGFLSTNVEPMELVINTAIGGEFLPNPDATTVWPQRLEVDWVRVYDAEPSTKRTEIVNPGFDANGGTLAGWSVFGNDLYDNPNVSVTNEVVGAGDGALKLFGTFGLGDRTCGVAQGIAVEGGQKVRATLHSYVKSDDSLADTDNTAAMKVEFYSEFGAKFNSPEMLSVEELQIADATSDTDVWIPHQLAARVPEGVVEARLSIVFDQPASGTGAVQVDNVTFQVVE